MTAALALSRAIGVTRLADVTRLDRIGMPVWQAVRPLSRAISVHQGKGASHSDARLGAILEGFESHSAEHFDAPRRRARLRDLPQAMRPISLADFFKRRDVAEADEMEVDWVVAETRDGDKMFVPHLAVSLDLTMGLGTPFERTSNGVAVGVTPDQAFEAALLELIERDAMAQWQRLPLLDRMACVVDNMTIAFSWLHHWLEKVRAADAELRCYAVPSLTDTPVFACEINDIGKSAAPFRAIHGHSAHAVPEVALFRAVAEAIQGRLAFVSGTRDDLMPADYSLAKDVARVAFGLPLPPGMAGTEFGSVGPRPLTVDQLSTALSATGIGPVLIVPLAEKEGFHAVRALACGLASRDRTRRLLAA